MIGVSGGRHMCALLRTDLAAVRSGTLCALEVSGLRTIGKKGSAFAGRLLAVGSGRSLAILEGSTC